MCHQVNQRQSVGAARRKKPARQITKYVTSVVYEIRLSRGKSYVRRMRYCINDVLREHANTLKNGHRKQSGNSLCHMWVVSSA